MFSATEEQRRLLANFVRARRERLKPTATDARRRTPGLRREEVAERAAISTTWYTWLEQAREVSLSADALKRLSIALKLSRAERDYLFELAGKRLPDRAVRLPSTEAPRSLATAVERVSDPAYGLDRFWTACCWNEAAEALFTSWLGGAERNLLRWLLLDESARSLIDGWEGRARRVIAEFRADFSRSIDDKRMRAFVASLRDQAPAFATWWDEQAVLRREGGLRRFRHPTGGALSYQQFTFMPTDQPEYKLVMLVPR